MNVCLAEGTGTPVPVLVRQDCSTAEELACSPYPRSLLVMMGLGPVGPLWVRETRRVES